MFNSERHHLIMGQILKDVYSDISISSLLGFKGGTCAYLFYDLPRFSVDLDFDLFKIDQASVNLVFITVEIILKKYGTIKDAHIKHQTIFFLLSYDDADHNVKVEINFRDLIPNLQHHYSIKEYLGISLFVANKAYLFASKLAALTDRKQLAMRDVYDIWFFAKNQWDIHAEVIRIRTGKTIQDYLGDCIRVIGQVKDNEVLQGLGELLGDQEKRWVKEHLRDEVVFLLRNYQRVLSIPEP